MIHRLLCVLLLSCLNPAMAQDAPLGEEATGVEASLLTVAEASGFERTATHEQVMALCARLAEASERITLDSMGTSAQGRDIPLLIVSDPPVEDAEAARKSGKLIVFLFGNIHAGEVCGKEALLILARELGLGERSDLLDDLVLLIAPIYNADGNDAFSPDNRPGQLGPIEMGERPNAQGFDLNRDYVKLEAPETRALTKLLTEWDPHLTVDTHTTNGSHHRHLITYMGPRHPAGDGRIIAYTRDTLLPAIDARFEDQTDWHAFFYGNFSDNHTKWTTYPAEPRYGAAARGLRNRLSILSEAYSYAPYKDRVLGTLAFCRAILRESAERRDEIRSLTREADARTIEAGRNPTDEDVVALRIEARAFPGKVTVLGYDEYDDEGNRSPWTGNEAARDYEVELVNDFVATLSVKRAHAYLFPESLSRVAEVLQRHGVEVREVREDIELDAQVYRIDAHTTADRMFEGHTMITGVSAAAIPRSVRARPGMFLVRTDQTLGNLASYLLEPQASDGLVAWNFFDEYLEAGTDFPVWRVPVYTPITSLPLAPLPEDRETDKPITFDALYGKNGEERVNLNGGPVRIDRWLDDEHYQQRKDGRAYRVHAATGRTEELDSDPELVGERLAQHPAIDGDDAERIARRWFANPNPQHERVVFTHAGDLYTATVDGSGVARLTATPEREEIPTLSPDGQFVAFVRENDLWVVDLETQTERALTSGGADDHRFGKASWVYYEEIFWRDWKAYWWSPDSQKLAYFETDSSSVPHFTIINDAEEPQRSETVRYPKPGDRNPHVRVHVVDRAGGSARELDLSAYDEGAYLVSHVQWTPDSTRVRLDIQDRAQTWLDLVLAPADGSAAERLFRETTEAWVESQHDATYLADGSFVLASERDGWRHLYLFNPDGTLKNQITSGEFEARTLHHVDEDAGWVYFSGTVDSPIATNLYRVRLDGTKLTRLTHEPGSHQVQLSPDAGMFIDRWSSFDTPTRVALRTGEGALIRVIDTNPVRDLERYRRGDAALLEISARDGKPLQGSILTPPGFDENRRYPVWFMTYGGPHAPTISDSWRGGRAYDHMLSQMGMVVFRMDPYPASGRGARSAWTCYKTMGQREMRDIEDAIAWLTQLPYVDADRIGMAGHSYGGYMTAYALTHSELFAAGIAGAPVTSFRDYDSIYTERYMDTPQNNPEGYDGTDLSRAAKNLHGRLLIAHGTMDDNVHLQNTIKLVGALQRAGKDFELMVYPGARHGGFGDHYRTLQHEFIRRTLIDAGPEEPEDPAPEPSEADLLDEVTSD